MMSLMSFGSRVASIVRNELRIRPIKLSKGCIRKASESRSRWNSSDFLLIKAAVSRSLSLPSGSKSCGMTIFSGYSYDFRKYLMMMRRTSSAMNWKMLIYWPKEKLREVSE